MNIEYPLHAPETAVGLEPPTPTTINPLERIQGFLGDRGAAVRHSNEANTGNDHAYMSVEVAQRFYRENPHELMFVQNRTGETSGFYSTLVFQHPTQDSGSLIIPGTWLPINIAVFGVTPLQAIDNAVISAHVRRRHLGILSSATVGFYSNANSVLANGQMLLDAISAEQHRMETLSPENENDEARFKIHASLIELRNRALPGGDIRSRIDAIMRNDNLSRTEKRNQLSVLGKHMTVPDLTYLMSQCSDSDRIITVWAANTISELSAANK